MKVIAFKMSQAPRIKGESSKRTCVGAHVFSSGSVHEGICFINALLQTFWWSNSEKTSQECFRYFEI